MVKSSIQANSLQERLWLNWKLDPLNPALNVSLAIDFVGRLNLKALNNSLMTLINEYYPAARCYFQQTDTHFLSVKTSPTIKNLDLLIKQDALELDKQIKDFISLPFDLEQGPLYRFLLIKNNVKSYALILVFHHIIIDGYSVNHLLNILQGLYNHYYSGSHKPAALENLPLFFSNSTENKAHLSFWLEELKAAKFNVNIFNDQISNKDGNYFLDFSLSPALAQLVNRRHLSNADSIFSIFITSFFVLLWRLSGQNNLTISYPVNLRADDSLTELNCHINNLAFSIEINPESSFEDLLQLVKAKRRRMRAHQQLGLLEIIKELKLTSKIPQGEFLNVELSESPLKFKSLKFDELESTSRLLTLYSDKDLRLYFDASEKGGYQLRFGYSARLESQFVSSLAQYFCNLLAGWLAQPNLKIKHFDYMLSYEKNLVVHQWNDSFRPYNLNRTIVDVFEQQVEQSPHHLALRYRHLELSYLEFNEQVNRFAHKLTSVLGASRTKPIIAICADRSVEMVVAIFAILKVGGAYMPLDPAWPTSRIKEILAQSGSQLVLLLPKYHFLFEEIPCELLDISADDYPSTNPAIPISPTDLCYVIYTSGSTGKPKGVMIEHQSILNRILWMQEAYQLKLVDKVLQKTPFSFDVSVWEFFWPLLTGATLVILEPEVHKDPRELTRFIQKNDITTIHFVPSMLRLWLEYAVDHADFKQYVKSLRHIFVSGESFTAELQKITQHYIEAPIYNLYGPTEAAVDVTAWACMPTLEDTATSIPIGKPIANTQIYILDTYLNPVPIGVVGELYIGGIGVARGYLNQPQLTAEKFIVNPFLSHKETILNSNSRLYRTGDLAYWRHDGSIGYVGRSDFQVKLHGLRVELGEVEAVLHNVYPQANWVVLSRVIRNSQHLVAYYVSQENYAEHDIRRKLSEVLSYYMIPDYFVHLDNLPLTESGKLDRKELLSLPLTHVELKITDRVKWDVYQKTVYEVWSKVLDVVDLSLESNFFSLGGNSIDCINIVLELEKRGLSVTPKTVLDYPVLADLAYWIESHSHAIKISKSIQPVINKVEEYYLLSPLQELMIRYYDESENLAVYHFQQCFWLEGMVYDLSILKNALEQVVRENPNLCPKFKLIDGKLKQSLSYGSSFDVHYSDLSLHSQKEQDGIIEEQLKHDKVKRFDLIKGDYARFYYFKLDSKRSALLISQHHAITDGWSNQLFLSRWFMLCDLLYKHKAIDLCSAENIYPRHVLNQYRYAQDKNLRLYWGQALKNLNANKVIFTENSSELIFSPSFSFPADLVADSIAFAQRQGVSLRALLFYGFLMALEKWLPSSNGGILVNGREAVLSGSLKTIGLFWNIVPWPFERPENFNRDALYSLQKKLNEIDFELGSFPYPELESMLKKQHTEISAIFNFTEFDLSSPTKNFKIIDFKFSDLYHFPLNFHLNYTNAQITVNLNYQHECFSFSQISAFFELYLHIIKTSLSE